MKGLPIFVDMRKAEERLDFHSGAAISALTLRKRDEVYSRLVNEHIASVVETKFPDPFRVIRLRCQANGWNFQLKVEGGEVLHNLQLSDKVNLSESCRQVLITYVKQVKEFRRCAELLASKRVAEATNHRFPFPIYRRDGSRYVRVQ